MPDIDHSDPIFEAWQYLNKTCTDWGEFNAYSQLCGVSLLPQEWRTLHTMAVKYLEGTQDGNPLSIDPEDRQQ